MPRPGPRPYECVRRAWHSERHQPMRGLIIQQIFRLAHDNHAAVTKKNREWTEKLPVVVLKAEAIMYSKANSEAEYSNIETLWNRVNDAVDTIIHKDDSTETGEQLPPCVEAALNLGCMPVRASRSQRHNNPRTYLRPTYNEHGDMSPKVLNENSNEHKSGLMPLHSSNSSKLKMHPDIVSPHFVWEDNKNTTPNTNQHVEKLPFVGKTNSTTLGHNTSLNRGSVYPLYYGMSSRCEVSQLGFQEPQKSDPIIFGVPIFSALAEPAEVGFLQNLFPHSEDKNVARETSEAVYEDKKGKRPQMGFDLSLRLGSFPSCETGSVGNRDSQSEGQHEDKEFHSFPMEPAYDLSWLRKRNRELELENHNAGLVSGKRKLPFNADVQNDQFFWSRDPNSNCFDGQMRRPNL